MDPLTLDILTFFAIGFGVAGGLLLGGWHIGRGSRSDYDKLRDLTADNIAGISKLEALISKTASDNAQALAEFRAKTEASIAKTEASVEKVAHTAAESFGTIRQLFDNHEKMINHLTQNPLTRRPEAKKNPRPKSGGFFVSPLSC